MITLIIFLISLHVQLVFLLVIFTKLSGYKEKKSKVVQKGVSIIIAAHNELLNLQNLIPQLLEQEYDDFEIILVNDRSTDGTKEYLLENYIKETKLRVIDIEERNPVYNPKKYAITAAIESSSNEILLLTDADCIPRSKLWIKEMVSGFTSKTEIVLGYSPYFPKPGLLNKLIRFETFYTAIQYLSLALAGHPYMGVGRNLAYTKRLFYANRGFKAFEHLTGGDDDLFVQKSATIKNVNIIINEGAHTVSLPKETWHEWFKQKKRHMSVGKYYNLKSRFIIGLLTITHVLFYLSLASLFYNSSWLIVGIVGYILRTTAIIFIFTSISKKLKEKFSGISLPLLDILYILNYLVVGVTAVISRKNTWR